MSEIARRRRTQPPPPHIVYQALIDPDRDPRRPWLILHEDEQRPEVVEAVEPDLVVWTSIWSWRRDARIRFELSGSRRSDTAVCWILTVDDPIPDNETILRMRKRVNVLINAHLRSTFGQ
ncbi:Uncharacterised protein [Rhodococcus rhodochrous]|uniref:hypothetical protein n=1 Tax=Rhodococcus rhodochrous TaxID=1829 RepID=UPI000750D053|nr:hypothetical protein [Rhodococcus rhodochrous]MDO1486636.1 hypothetical protein [Rhodococcus rhodochrous]NLE80292.1 hypothetical protein [Rhodococcus sp. (in: high G+C Gram-positive bacteria)]SNV20042.1 Uncharacterised protein [Rhodococcus rhodochrous]